MSERVSRAPLSTPWIALIWILLLAAWEAIVRLGLSQGMFLPAPSRIVRALVQLLSGEILPHLGVTLTRIGGGLAIGGTGGVVAGLLMGTQPRVRRVIDPLVAALHPIPRLAFFPLLIVLLGIGERSKMAAVALGAVFPLVLNTVVGVRGITRAHLDIARNCGAGRRQLFRHVLLPGSMPMILTGLRLSANAAFHSAIGVEMVGSRTGIGALLWLSWQSFRIDQLYAVLVVVAAVGIAMATLVRRLSHRAAPWIIDQAPMGVPRG